MMSWEVVVAMTSPSSIVMRPNSPQCSFEPRISGSDRHATKDVTPVIAAEPPHDQRAHEVSTSCPVNAAQHAVPELIAKNIDQIPGLASPVKNHDPGVR